MVVLALFFECELWVFWVWLQNILKLILLLNIVFAMLKAKCAVAQCMFENVHLKRKIKTEAKAKPLGGLKLEQFALQFLQLLPHLVQVRQFKHQQFLNLSLFIFQIFHNGLLQ